MARRRMKKTHLNGNKNEKKSDTHPIFKQKLSFSQRATDAIAGFCGSWVFISSFILFLVIWVALNAWIIAKKPFDSYPYSLLNLTISGITAIQAPLILMAQNRQIERDRISAKYNYHVNRKAEREIEAVQEELKKIERMIKKV